MNVISHLQHFLKQTHLMLSVTHSMLYNGWIDIVSRIFAKFEFV